MMTMSTDDGVTFEQPKIGPRAYIAKGPSGWIETFPRAAADKALEVFVMPLDLDELVSLFLTARELNKTPIDWFTIIGFLGRTMQCSPRSVPHDVGVAFWARVVLTAMSSGAN